MRRWLSLGLLLSVGVNLGLLAAAAAGSWGRAPGDPTPAVAAPPEVGGGEPAGAPAGAEEPGETTFSSAGAAAPPGVAAPAGGAEPGATAEPAAAAAPPVAPPAEPDPGVAPGPPRAGAAEPYPGAAAAPLPVPPRVGPRAGVRAVERLADHLGLTGEQRRRFVALQRRLFERMGDLQAERRRLDLALRRELVAPDPDRRRIGDLVDRLGEVHAAGQGVTAETILESRALLDGDQQVLYLRFLQRLRAGRRGDTLPDPPARRHPLRE